MAYIGNRPEQGNFRKCDAITTSATATYNLLVGGVAVNPNQNQCIVSLNGVIQSSGNSYTIASSQITFSQALTSSDVIDFILILGDTLDVGVPSDDTVDASKITANVITGQTALGATPADTDELLISDAGVLKRVDYSYLKGEANTPSFAVKQSGDQSIATATTTIVTFNTEDFDTDSAYNTSSYRFVVPSGAAGKYFFSTRLYMEWGNTANELGRLGIYKNGTAEAIFGGLANGTENQGKSLSINTILDLAVSDYVDVRMYHTQGGAQSTASDSDFTYFYGYKLIWVI